MRVVIDTSVTFSALYSPGIPRRAFLRAFAECEVYTSFFLLSELDRVLQAKLKFNRETRARITEQLKSSAKVIDPKPLKNPIKNIGDDNKVLACAESAQADFLITSDKELIGLKKCGATAIVNPRTFLDASF